MSILKYLSAKIFFTNLAIAVILVTICSGCANIRRHREAEKIMRLLKNGNYAKVKMMSHYNNSWDPDDSIFNQSVRFIHKYLNRYGYPPDSDYKSISHRDEDNMIKIYLEKASLMDSTLNAAYVELDFYNISRDFRDTHRVEAKLFIAYIKTIAPPSIDNFYLIRMKK